MEIRFENNNLERYAFDEKYRVKKLGSKQAIVLKKRLDSLLIAVTLEDCRHVPGRLHLLTSNRQGQFSFHLIEPYRLIFIPDENPIPIDKSGNLIWSEIKNIKIIEIINYHEK